jgi:Ca2+-binding RTX toxin-like protein
MTTTILTTDVIGSNLTYTFTTAGDIFVLAANTRFIADGYSYLYGITPGVSVTIDGYVWLQGDAGTFGSPFYFGGGDRITIGVDAVMVLTSDTTAPYGGIMLGQNVVGGTDFTNYGHITTLVGAGVVVDGGNNTLRNYGTIDVVAGTFSYGSGSNDVLLNAGTITGKSTASSGVVAINGAGNALTNTGDIMNVRIGGYGVVDNSTSGITTIVNTGDIIAGSGYGIGSNGANVILNNSGTIVGQLAALNLTSGSNTVTNTGHLAGNVIFGAGADIFRGIGGTVAGTINGGGESDTYYTSDSAMTIIEGAVLGTDTVYATVNFRLAANLERLYLLGFAETGIGNASGNIIAGSAGDNRLFGLGGLDNIAGLEGNDTIGGGDGNDTLQGGDGDDWLRGAAGNDSLTAGGDNDTLIGALGVDTLRGGTGNDQFIFLRQTDSGKTAATSDLIADFVRGQDVIDLFGIDARTNNAAPNDTFTFIGAAAFTNVAGQVRYASAAGVTTVIMDMDGNGTADMTIRLTGTLALTAQDFIL